MPVTNLMPELLSTGCVLSCHSNLRTNMYVHRALGDYATQNLKTKQLSLLSQGVLKDYSDVVLFERVRENQTV